MDETYFLFSEKGKRNIEGRKPRKRGGSSIFRGISHEQVCILIARDRQKSTFSGVLGKGRIVKTQLDKAIGSKLSSDNTPFVLMLGELFRLMQIAKDWSITVSNPMAQNELKGFIIFKMSTTITAD